MRDRSSGRLLVYEAKHPDASAGQIVLDGGTVTVGRAPSCTLSLAGDHQVSRLHAVLRFDGEYYLISDLASSNGTLLNGRLLEEAANLNEGDRITIGNHVLIYTLTLPAPMPPPTSGPEPIGAERSDPGAPALPTTQGASATRAQVMAPDPRVVLSEPTVPFAPSGPVEITLAPPPPVAGATSDSSPFPAVQAASGTTGQLTRLRGQLVESSSILAEWAERTARINKHLRAELAELVRTADTALTNAGYGTHERQMGATLEELIRIAEQAESHPDNFDLTVSLATRAPEIARLLRSHRAMLAVLESVRERVAELAHLGS